MELKDVEERDIEPELSVQLQCKWVKGQFGAVRIGRRSVRVNRQMANEMSDEDSQILEQNTVAPINSCTEHSSTQILY